MFDSVVLIGTVGGVRACVLVPALLRILFDMSGAWHVRGANHLSWQSSLTCPACKSAHKSATKSLEVKPILDNCPIRNNKCSIRGCRIVSSWLTQQLCQPSDVYLTQFYCTNKEMLLSPLQQPPVEIQSVAVRGGFDVCNTHASMVKPEGGGSAF